MEQQLGICRIDLDVKAKRKALYDLNLEQFVMLRTKIIDPKPNRAL